MGVDLSTARVTVVGLGLMGGSLGGALRGRCRSVVGVDRRHETINVAQVRGLIDQGTTDLARGVHGADVVVLATPVRVILRLLDEIAPLLQEGCLLLDVGSTKAAVVDRMAALPDSIQPLGGHPMCGKEHAGIEAADPALYQGATFVLTPLPRTAPQALSLGRSLVEAAGARPLILPPRRHDRLVATVSHLPYLLACGLVGATVEVAAVDPTVWQVAASGFRDTSRLAASDVTMMLDILLTNRAAVLAVLDRFRDQLGVLRQLLGTGDEAALRAALEQVQQTRSEWRGS
jgi:prephenate dehydrogenase